MGEQKAPPYFQVEGRGLVRLIAFVIAIVAAIPIVKKISIMIDGGGFAYAFRHGDWTEALMVVGMLVIMMVAGSVALKGKFSIP